MAWPYGPRDDKLEIDCSSPGVAIWGLNLTQEEEEEEEKEEEEEGRLLISTTFITEWDRTFPALKLERPCPLVLLVKVG